jgi:hypothetical protein
MTKTTQAAAARGWGGLGWRIALTVLLLAAGIALLLVDLPPVALTWETASEVGTAGFNVYRAPVGTTDPGGFMQVNDALIPAQGDELTGAAYRFVDETVRPGHRYVYQIEEVEWDGTTTRYPMTVQVRAGLPARWIKAEGGLLLVLALVLLLRSLRRR